MEYSELPAMIRSGLSEPRHRERYILSIAGRRVSVVKAVAAVVDWLRQNSLPEVARLIPPTVPVAGAPATSRAKPPIALPLAAVPSP